MSRCLQIVEFRLVRPQGQGRALGLLFVSGLGARASPSLNEESDSHARGGVSWLETDQRVCSVQILRSDTVFRTFRSHRLAAIRKTTSAPREARDCAEKFKRSSEMHLQRCMYSHYLQILPVSNLVGLPCSASYRPAA